MLSENLKTLRKQRNMSQEALAEHLHVVRQTVSKWEQGLSVPDAEMLIRIADFFQVPVSDLLGEQVQERDMNKIAVQLALLNEQLISRRPKTGKIVRNIVIGLVAGLVLCIVIYIGAHILFGFQYEKEYGQLTTASLTCTLDGETYLYEVVYDQQFKVRAAGGDAWVADHTLCEEYQDANTMIAQIEDYFKDRGGTVKIEIKETPQESQ